jgi:hypothetical protein
MLVKVIIEIIAKNTEITDKTTKCDYNRRLLLCDPLIL